MVKLQKIILVSSIAMLLLVGYIALKPEKNVGSVSQNNQYNYTQLTGSVASSTASINVGRTTLGSIIITEDSAVAVDVYDATSTEAIGSPYATKVADLEATLTEGVYTFDVGVTYGLVLNTTDWTAFDGDWTVTYRQGW